MFRLFNWIRSNVRDAILGGVADAVESLDGKGDAAEFRLPEAISRRLGLPALPSSTPEPASEPETTDAEPATRRRKAS